MTLVTGRQLKNFGFLYTPREAILLVPGTQRAERVIYVGKYFNEIMKLHKCKHVTDGGQIEFCSSKLRDADPLRKRPESESDTNEIRKKQDQTFPKSDQIPYSNPCE